MIINAANIDVLFSGFNTSFTKGQQGAPSKYKDVAMTINSSTSENIYGWLGQFPRLREWIGDRVVKNLTTSSYALSNVLFESTVGVSRVAIEDDQYGLFSSLFEEMGRAAGDHPDELVFSLLSKGMLTDYLGYDDVPFFSGFHPVGMGEDIANVSNYNGSGTGNFWYLLDASRPIKPLIFQERIPYQFQALTKEGDDNVFHRDTYEYGIRARVNAGFGLWQLAYASRADLTPENYAAARNAMMVFKSDEGRPLGVVPNKLIVGASLEQAARKLVNNELVSDGAGGSVSNEWKGSVDLIVVPWLD